MTGRWGPGSLKNGGIAADQMPPRFVVELKQPNHFRNRAIFAVIAR